MINQSVFIHGTGKLIPVLAVVNMPTDIKTFETTAIFLQINSLMTNKCRHIRLVQTNGHRYPPSLF
jgi:hypothetical protein